MFSLALGFPELKKKELFSLSNSEIAGIKFEGSQVVSRSWSKFLVFYAKKRLFSLVSTASGEKAKKAKNWTRPNNIIDVRKEIIERPISCLS